MNDKKERCKGSGKTDFENKVFSTVKHSYNPNVAAIEAMKKLKNAMKRVGDELSVPVFTIFLTRNIRYL